MVAPIIGVADRKAVGRACASVLSHDPSVRIESITFVTIASSDESPFGDGGYCMEHTRATIDPETLREFYEACEVSGSHPALVLQQAVDNAMRVTIATATEEVSL